MQERLDFLKNIDIFGFISTFSMLPIINKLKSKKFKLGQQILVAGRVPQGLYIIKSGYCKVGIVKHVPYDLVGKDESWFREKPTPMKYKDNMTDPLPHDKKNFK